MKKKMRKAVGAIFLVIALLITQIPPVGANAASDFQMNGNTLMKYTGTTSVVSVPSGTEAIAAEAFADCTTITSITLPQSVETIGSAAFRGCSALKSVTVSQGCETIDSQAFADCTQLTGVNLPASLEYLGSGVFAGDTKLTGVAISSSNDDYVCTDGVIYNQDKTKVVEMLPGRTAATYTMPSTVTDVEKYAFWGCKNLTEVNLGSNLKEIPAYAFSYCRGLEQITLPYSISKIQAKAFENCRKLQDVTIPASVSFIHDTAFDGCYQLNILAPENSVADIFFQNFEVGDAALADYEENEEETTAVDLSKTVSDNHASDVTSQTASDLSSATVDEIPDGAEVIGRTKIVGSQAVVFLDNTKVDILEGEEDPTKSLSVSENTDSDDSEPATVKYTLVNGDTIADKAYYGAKTLTDYNFPKGVTKLGDFSFARSALESITIPAGVTHIGYGAFYHCDNLKNVYIPSTVTEIEPAAFAHTQWLFDWENGGDVDEFLVVGDGILIDYKGLGSVVRIPTNVKKIAAEVFANHTEIQAVYLPDTLTEIGEDAFYGCTNLTQVSGGNQLVKICDRAFYNVPIKTVRIPQTVTAVGLKAFSQEELMEDNSSTSDAVVFMGTKLPKLSYEKTATRLSNEYYRDLAVEGVSTAVVEESVTEFSDTILDEDTLGFRGLVVSVLTEPTDSTYGSVKLKHCTLLPDQQTGIVSVPEQVSIYGQEYKIVSVEADAFDAYKHIQDWSEYQLTAIEISPSITGGANIEQGIWLATTPGRVVQTVSDNSAYIQINKAGNLENTETFLASFAQREDFFLLDASSETPKEAILRQRVAEQYGAANNDQLYVMDLTLFDATGAIPITRLGSEPLTITMSIPPGMEDDTLCVVCLDNNEQLETNYITYVAYAGETCIQFEVKHFSPYGIYAATGQLAQTIDAKLANNTAGSLRDASPDTGDFFDPRWVLAMGFVCLGLILLIRKDKRIVL